MSSELPCNFSLAPGTTLRAAGNPGLAGVELALLPFVAGLMIQKVDNCSPASVKEQSFVREQWLRIT